LSKLIAGMTAFVISVSGMVHEARADVAAMGKMTRAMVLEAADYFHSVPFKKAEAAFNDLQSDRWLKQPHHIHMFAMRTDGMVWADNVFHEFVGVDFSQVYDLDGFQFGKAILERTAETDEPIVVNIKFLSPANGNETIGLGTCLRPDADNVLCSWSEQE